jgi:hypothetical protein
MITNVDAGCVSIRVQSNGAKVIATQVESERPQVAQAFIGRQADDAAALIPLVFALCGRAQGAAARLAVAAARGEESSPRVAPEILREVMREHLWRWLLDLPALFDMLPFRDQFSTAVRAVETNDREAVQRLLAAPEVKRLVGLITALEQPPLGDVAVLRMDSARISLSEWPRLSAELCRRPTWRGQAAETGAYARRKCHSPPVSGAFAVRWLARLTEIETWAAGVPTVGAGGTASAMPVVSGVGRALVETARGLLMHEVILEGGRIADYRIVAPTEWNFHPLGPLAAWLIGSHFSDEVGLRQFAAQAVAALDPCVRWELELEIC